LPNRRFDLPAGETQPVWVTIQTSPGTPAGVHKAHLEVSWKGKILRKMEYTVRVFDVDLPKQQRLHNATFMPAVHLSAHYKPQGGITSPEFIRLYERWAHKAFSMHVGPTFDMMMGWSALLEVPGGGNPLGEMRLGRQGTSLIWPVLGTPGHYDFSLVDRLGAIGREFGMKQFSIAVFDRRLPWEKYTEELKRDLTDFLRAYAGHLRAQGTLHEAYVYNLDEPPAKLFDTVRRNYELVKQAVPDLKVWLCLNEPKGVTALVGATDIWDVYIRQYDQSGIEKFRRPQDQVIWAVCVWPHEHPNLFIEYPAVDARAIGWLTYTYGISGFEYWGLNYWGKNIGRHDWANFKGGDTRTSWQRTPWPWGDGWLLYPGEGGEPLSSVRLENVRDGFEDAELLLLLASENEKAEADRIGRSVAPSIDSYQKDPAAFAKARLELLTALARARKHGVQGAPPPPDKVR
jgi:glycosyl hydrolase family 123